MNSENAKKWKSASTDEANKTFLIRDEEKKEDNILKKKAYFIDFQPLLMNLINQPKR